MADLKVVALLRAKEGSVGVLRDALQAIVEPTRAEPGCLAYDLFESTVDPNTMITVELWRSQADLDAHMETAHIAGAIAAVGDHFAGPPEIHPLSPA